MAVKSITTEREACEKLAAGSAVAVLNVVRAGPDAKAGDVDELEGPIGAGKMPRRSAGVLDRERA